LPVVSELQQQPVKEAALLAKSLEQPAVAYGLKMPSFSVYRDAITPRRAPQPGELVFTRVDKLTELRDKYPALSLKVLYRKGGILLLGSD